MSNKMNTKKTSEIKLQIGTSSILLIFVIVCLVSFATLAIVSANADNRLSAKVAQRTLNYYEACNQAEAALEELDVRLAQAYEDSGQDMSAFLSSASTLPTVYEYPLAPNQLLRVSIEVTYPEHSGDHFYRLMEYKVINLQD